jgi:hypothetical protein
MPQTGAEQRLDKALALRQVQVTGLALQPVPRTDLVDDDRESLMPRPPLHAASQSARTVAEQVAEHGIGVLTEQRRRAEALSSVRDSLIGLPGPRVDTPSGCLSSTTMLRASTCSSASASSKRLTVRRECASPPAVAASNQKFPC